MFELETPETQKAEATAPAESSTDREDGADVNVAPEEAPAVQPSEDGKPEGDFSQFFIEEGNEGQKDTSVTEPSTQTPETETKEAKGDQPADPLAELSKKALDPDTPEWFRNGVEKANAIAQQRTAEAEKYQSELQALQEQAKTLEGREAVDGEELGRLKQAQSVLADLQRFTATPAELDEALQKINAEVYGDFKNETVWNALYKQDGTPDYENFQMVLDRGLNQNEADENRVFAQDAIEMLEAYREGKFSKDAWHEFETTEQYDAFKRTEEAEKSFRARELEAQKTSEFNEGNIRAQEVTKIRGEIQSQIVPQIHKKLADFKLLAVENEPKVFTDFKQRAIDRLQAVIDNAKGEIQPLVEIEKALGTVAKAKGIDPAQAVAQVQDLYKTDQFSTLLNAGTSAMMEKVDEAIRQESAYLALMAKGYEVQNSQASQARDITGKTKKVGAGLPNLSEEDLAKLSSTERMDYILRHGSEMITQGAGDEFGTGAGP